jgi:hypothetical protein
MIIVGCSNTQSGKQRRERSETGGRETGQGAAPTVQERSDGGPI